MSQLAIFLILWTTMLANGEKTQHLSQFIPQEMHDWKSAGKDETYDRNTIFRYIDGGGELFRSYGFRELIVRRFTKTDQPDIVVELYDMGSSQDAYGIFSYERESESIGVGQGSEYGTGSVRFWKGNLFVSLFAEQETPPVKQTLLDLARAIAKAIPSLGAKPRLVSYLPTKGLLDKSVRYFHNHGCLNYHYFLSNQNILNLDEHTEAVLARYQQGEHKSYVLLVHYTDAHHAKGAFISFVDAFIPEAKQKGIAKIEDGKWIAAKVHQEWVIIVLEAPSEAEASDLREAVRSRLVKSVGQ